MTKFFFNNQNANYFSSEELQSCKKIFPKLHSNHCNNQLVGLTFNYSLVLIKSILCIIGLILIKSNLRFSHRIIKVIK